jgi:hypothetical protein
MAAMAAGAQGKPRFEKDQKNPGENPLESTQKLVFMCFRCGNAIFIRRRDTIVENGWYGKPLKVSG